MTRLPFDFDPGKLPDRPAGPPARRERQNPASQSPGTKVPGKDRHPAPASQSPGTPVPGKVPGKGPPPLTVAQAVDLIKQTLSDNLPTRLRLVGELSNLRDRRHWYFSLKDEHNVIDAVMWASDAAKLKFRPENGQQVLASGRIDFYGPQGKLQVYVTRLEPVGMGSLEQRFRQLCEQLRQAGYFDPAHKRPMPVFAQRLCVVTSASGAALHDFVQTARSRWPGVEILLMDVLVQGAEAPRAIARAIDQLSAAGPQLGIDAIVLTRGGGSLEDLWAFNEQIVAEAVYRCAVPIAVGVGHETDTTIAELVADLRCSTPTQAAERLVPDAPAEAHRLDQLDGRLSLAMRRMTQEHRRYVEALAGREMFRRPTQVVGWHARELDNLQRQLNAAATGRISRARQRVSELWRKLDRFEPRSRFALAQGRLVEVDRRLVAAGRHRLDAAARHLAALERQLEAVSPTNVLKRGYSYTSDQAGRLIRSVGQVSGGQRITTHLADGQFASRVEDGGSAPVPRQPARRPRRRRPPSGRADADGGLFDQLD
jgi:exodeoxyribonuclease VII large subunit